jgi:hypothetical protein
MKADLRISIKDYRRGKNLKVLLYRVPFGTHKFWVRMNGPAWPKDAVVTLVTDTGLANARPFTGLKPAKATVLMRGL